MKPRRRCPRGHFAPAAGTCRCTRTRTYHPDLTGQGLPTGVRITTIQLTTDHL